MPRRTIITGIVSFTLIRKPTIIVRLGIVGIELDRLALDMLGILQQCLVTAPLDRDRLHLAILLTLSRRAYVEALLYRDYRVDRDSQWYSWALPDGSSARIHEQGIVYLHKVLARRPKLARRLKHGENPFAPDQAHLHFRFLRRGFSQRRAALTMWAWAASLGAAALATRFIPFRAGGEWHPWETVAVAAIAFGALAFSVYVVYLLEIVKLASPRARRRARADDAERLSA